MAGLRAVPDPLDRAIAAAQTGPTEVTVRMRQVQLTLPGGRPALLAVPEDLTDLEALGLIGAVLQVRDQIHNAQPRSRLLVPHR
jgi:hypothetical protein